MARGTFANIRLVNKFMKKVTYFKSRSNKLIKLKAGPKTLHFPTNDELSIFDAAMRYKEENVTAIILGKT